MAREGGERSSSGGGSSMGTNGLQGGAETAFGEKESSLYCTGRSTGRYKFARMGIGNGDEEEEQEGKRRIVSSLLERERMRGACQD